MKTALMILIACASLGAHAATHHDGEDDPDSDLPPWADERLDPFHHSVSQWVENTSRRIDSFFGTTDALSVETDSYLRIGPAWRWREGDAFDQDLGASFRLDLPTTEQRLRLVIESEPEETRGTLAEQESTLADERPDRGGRLRIGINRLGDRDKTRQWNTQVGAGLRARLPPDPYARVISQRLWTLGHHHPAGRCRGARSRDHPRGRSLPPTHVRAARSSARLAGRTGADGNRDTSPCCESSAPDNGRRG